jgi:hypothetical protein
MNPEYLKFNYEAHTDPCRQRGNLPVIDQLPDHALSGAPSDVWVRGK